MKVLLRDLVAPLTAVLDDLMTSDLERRPFVIVEDVVTHRFVQFIRRYHPKTGELLFDVPALGVVLQPCVDIHVGVSGAMIAFCNRFELPPDAELTITTDGDPLS